ncbi:unnamed protein product [Dracunculus medinensis]|uniref:CMP/dCMP-type deaminase domain-containing protein n=1 Tax=Dracunculus medinensis TaxID=318479 RepID=A0A0N4UA77_DRAME|nr:unnamed protein product [Dracunculus medinensis]
MDFMHKAIEEACHGVQAGDGGPFGAVIARQRHIVAVGHNMVLLNNDPTAHAEIIAIRKACAVLKTYDLSGCVLYTSCYPCPMCMTASLWARIHVIYYSATAQDAAKAGFDDKIFHDFVKDPKSDNIRRLEQLNVPEVLKPFEMWAAKEDKTIY